MPAIVCLVISHNWAIHTLRWYRARQPEHLYEYTSPVVVRRSSGRQKVIATEPRRCCPVSVAQAGQPTAPGPVLRLLPGATPGRARQDRSPQGQVTSLTRPATGRAQPEPTPDKRQKETGPGDRGLPGDIYHYIDIHFSCFNVI